MIIFSLHTYLNKIEACLSKKLLSDFRVFFLLSLFAELSSVTKTDVRQNIFLGKVKSYRGEQDIVLHFTMHFPLKLTDCLNHLATQEPLAIK